MGDVSDYSWETYYYPGKGYHIGALQANSEPDLKALSAYIITNAHYETFQTKRGAAGGASVNYYQVPAGKILYIVHIYFTSYPGDGWITLGYGDDAVAEGAVAPTNGVALFPPWALAAYEAGKWYDIPMFAAIPAGKYPYLYGEAGKCGARITGVEV
jgi:hypothetical protein